MGNNKSKPAGTNSESIEEWYAARALESKAINARIAAAHNKEAEALTSDCKESNSYAGVKTEDEEKEDEDKLDADAVDADEDSSMDGHARRVSASLANTRALDSIRNLPASTNATEAAMIHITTAVRAFHMKAHHAIDIAIDALKSIDVVAVVQAALNWMKAHPWETAAIAIPLILLACTPAFLAAAGFTASGIAAGSLAAGIQAGIGSVAAGSTFATLTSAAMAGYGVPIVFGSVWGISSAVCWELAAWNKWRARGDVGDHGARDNGRDEGEGDSNSDSPHGGDDGGDSGSIPAASMVLVKED